MDSEAGMDSRANRANRANNEIGHPGVAVGLVLMAPRVETAVAARTDIEGGVVVRVEALFFRLLRHYLLEAFVR
jgi:hypothetical protein